MPAHACLVRAGFAQDKDGTLLFKYDPCGSEAFWDKQSIARNGEGLRLFVDKNGQVWTEEQIELGA